MGQVLLIKKLDKWRIARSSACIRCLLILSAVLLSGMFATPTYACSGESNNVSDRDFVPIRYGLNLVDNGWRRLSDDEEKKYTLKTGIVSRVVRIEKGIKISYNKMLTFDLEKNKLFMSEYLQGNSRDRYRNLTTLYSECQKSEKNGIEKGTLCPILTINHGRQVVWWNSFDERTQIFKADDWDASFIELAVSAESPDLIMLKLYHDEPCGSPQLVDTFEGLIVPRVPE